MPPHESKLKLGMPIMTLRNLKQAGRQATGTILMIQHISNHILQAPIMNGNQKGEEARIRFCRLELLLALNLAELLSSLQVPPQSQQKAASNVYHTQGPISHQKEALQPNPVKNSQTQNCVNSNHLDMRIYRDGAPALGAAVLPHDNVRLHSPNRFEQVQKSRQGSLAGPSSIPYWQDLLAELIGRAYLPDLMAEANGRTLQAGTHSKTY
ncbi:MAG: hypothetical protein FRX49_13151 [Trebouxia sp. A1-2]|nr:MAG: hypothetical protein FRX49_13151 [Trebouxia sp. A1-2]